MYHLTQAAHFLNRRLSLPVDEHEVSLIWASSLLLHRAVLAAIDCYEPHQAWPNRSRGSVDLDWFRFAYKARVFTAHLQRSERLPRYGRTETEAIDITPATLTRTTQVQCLITSLEEMCTKLTNLGNTSDPRFTLFRALEPLVGLPNQPETSMAQLVPVLQALDASFVVLLESKDPVSLLLMSILNAHLCSRDWWMARRAKVEGQAICLYLEMHCTNMPLITKCLWYPRLLLESVP